MAAVEQGSSSKDWRRISQHFIIGCLAGWTALLAMSPARAEVSEIRRVPAADWVVAVERGTVDEKLLGQISDGTYYLLSDAQINAEGERHLYRRFASKAINAAGVDSLATIEIGFDPEYQTLDLNTIDLIRDGRTISKLAGATLRVLQRETELERRIYDGSKSATIFLEDVRVGDIVDYSYTVHGRNPVFDGLDFGTIGLQYYVPIARIHGRLLAPAGHEFSVVPRNSTIEISARNRNGMREFEWDTQHVAALIPDADAPAWHDPFPAVQWSEFADWQAVTRWALPLYAIPQTLSPEVEAEVQRIAKAESSPEGRLLAALRFVQSEIRYLGVEIGAGSHAPNPPDQVLARRFGDCKDKTLLTLTLLDRLGIEAHPALVDTERRRALANRMPSPGQFDHVIVQAKLGDRTIWLDPTRPTQNADLDHLVQPDFDLALVVDDNGNGLVSMNEGRKPSPARVVNATFDGSAGFEKPVPFTVVTTLEGERAETMRNSLATSNLEEMQKQFLNYYADYFSGLEIAESMQVNDDEINNRIVTTESYRIPEFSDWSETTRQHTAYIPTPDLDEKLRSPKSTIRNSPLWVSRSNDLTLITETLLPEAWTIKPDRTTIKDPAFTFERVIAHKGNSLLITDTFKSLVDEVAAADITRYANHLSEARDQTLYQLYWGEPSATAQQGSLDRINWLLILIGAMALAMWIWLAGKLYRYDPLPRPGFTNRSPQGLGGWLVLPGIGLIATPIAALHSIVTSLDAWSADTWTRLTTFGNVDYHALWAPTLLFELVTLLGILVFGILVAILFFRRRSNVPTLFIALHLTAAAQLMIDTVLVHAIPQADVASSSFAQEIGALARAAIWILYFLVSVRVRNTFVVRLKQSAVTQPAVPREAFSL